MVILFFRIALKDIFCAVRNSGLVYGIRLSVNNRMIVPFGEGFISRNFAYVKFRENKNLTKISEFTVFEASADMILC